MTDRLALIERASYSKKAWDRVLREHVREAINSGHSYRQVAKAARVSLSVIQRIMKEKSDAD